MKRQSIRTLLAQQEDAAAPPLPSEPPQPTSQTGQPPVLPPPVPPATSPETNKPAKVERIKPGYSLRRDLIKECKRIAVEEDRAIYEVIEEAIEMLLQSRKSQSSS